VRFICADNVGKHTTLRQHCMIGYQRNSRGRRTREQALGDVAQGTVKVISCLPPAINLDGQSIKNDRISESERS